MKNLILCLAALALALAACDDPDDPPPSAADAAPGADAAQAPVDGALPDAAPADAGPPEGLGRCVYTNRFSGGDECKDYTGAGWTAATAEADCQAVFLNRPGTWEAGLRCAYPAELGACVVGDPAADGYTIISAGDDPGTCGLAQTGCEGFGGGRFEPRGACVSDDRCPEPEPSVGNVFTQPYTDCRPPLAGEPPGAGPDGQVCTPVIVSGCTEPGRRFADYASCADVVTQRPYSAYLDVPAVDPADPRLEDAAYLAELDWFKGEVEACACACCHTQRDTPSGASLWDTEAGPLWIDTIPDTGMAMLAGWVDSAAFGAVDPPANNGFDRIHTGQPTTDTERLRAFLAGELARRGKGQEDFARTPPFGGPLAVQATFTPQPCGRGQGVEPDGTVIWNGGGARYVYVLEVDAANPGTPPNRDLPEGTLWHVQVPSDQATPLGCGFRYGETPTGAQQRAPADGAPPALVDGETYYLYVLRDVGLPITRCLFTYAAP